MTIEEAVAELAEGSADLSPLLQRLNVTVERIQDPDLSRQLEELVHLNGRMWMATSVLLHHAEDELKKKEGTI